MAEKGIKGIVEISELEPNWDNEGAPAASAMSLEIARIMLNSPWVVPCFDGGVELEWCEQGWDICIDISPEGKLTAGAYKK